MAYTSVVATAVSILLCQGCIFRTQGVYCCVRGVYFEHREYTAVSGVYISNAGSILLCRGVYFERREYIAESGVYILAIIVVE